MRNRNTNIFLRGTAILLLIVATVLTISSLVGYSRQRNNYPPGMTIGGVPVGGLDPQAASQRVLQVYSTPVEIQYGGGTIQVEPANIGFQMDLESMLAAADLARTGGAFWGGFWDYLWNRDPTPRNSAVPRHYRRRTSAVLSADRDCPPLRPAFHAGAARARDHDLYAGSAGADTGHGSRRAARLKTALSSPEQPDRNTGIHAKLSRRRVQHFRTSKS